MAKTGRPKLPEHRVKPLIRSVAFPPDLYELIRIAAEKDRRDVTSFIVKTMEDRVKSSGNSAGMALGNP